MKNEHTGRPYVVRWVFAAVDHGRIAIVDLPEDLAAVVSEGPEVVARGADRCPR